MALQGPGHLAQLWLLGGPGLLDVFRDAQSAVGEPLAILRETSLDPAVGHGPSEQTSKGNALAHGYTREDLVHGRINQ